MLRKVGVEEGKTSLDYGCGSGRFTIPMAKIVGNKGKGYVLDVHPSFLERDKEVAQNEGLGNIETVLCDSSTFATG